MISAEDAASRQLNWLITDAPGDLLRAWDETPADTLQILHQISQVALEAAKYFEGLETNDND